MQSIKIRSMLLCHVLRNKQIRIICISLFCTSDQLRNGSLRRELADGRSSGSTNRHLLANSQAPLNHLILALSLWSCRNQNHTIIIMNLNNYFSQYSRLPTNKNNLTIQCMLQYKLSQLQGNLEEKQAHTHNYYNYCWYGIQCSTAHRIDTSSEFRAKNNESTMGADASVQAMKLHAIHTL